MTPLRLKILCAAMQYPTFVSAANAYANGYVYCSRETARRVLEEAAELRLVHRSMRHFGGLRLYKVWPDADSKERMRRELRCLTSVQLEAYVQYAEAIATFLADDHKPRWWSWSVYDCWRELSTKRWERRYLAASELLVAITTADLRRAGRSSHAS